jgi:hypothetical protein
MVQYRQAKVLVREWFDGLNPKPAQDSECQYLTKPVS